MNLQSAAQNFSPATGVYKTGDRLAAEVPGASASAPIGRPAHAALDGRLEAWQALRLAERAYANHQRDAIQEKRGLAKLITSIDRKLALEKAKAADCQSAWNELKPQLREIASKLEELNTLKNSAESSLRNASAEQAATGKVLQEKIEKRDQRRTQVENAHKQFSMQAQQLHKAKEGLVSLWVVSKDDIIQNLPSPEKILGKKNWQTGERRRIEILKEIFYKALENDEVRINFNFVFDGLHALMASKPATPGETAQSSPLPNFAAEWNVKNVSEQWHKDNAETLNRLIETSSNKLHQETSENQGSGRYGFAISLSIVSTIFLMMKSSELQTLWKNIRLSAQHTISSVLTSHAEKTLLGMADFEQRFQLQLSEEEAAAAQGNPVPAVASVINFSEFFTYWQYLMHDVIDGNQGGDFYKNTKAYLAKMTEIRDGLKQIIRNFGLGSGGGLSAPQVVVDLVTQGRASLDTVIQGAQRYQQIDWRWKDSHAQILINALWVVSIAVGLYSLYRQVRINLSTSRLLENLPQESAKNFLRSSLHEIAKKYKNINLEAIVHTLNAELTEKDKAKFARLPWGEFPDELMGWIDARLSEYESLAEEQQYIPDESLNEEISRLGRLTQQYQSTIKNAKAELAAVEEQLKTPLRGHIEIQRASEKNQRQLKKCNDFIVTLLSKKAVCVERLQALDHPDFWQRDKDGASLVAAVREKSRKVDELQFSLAA